MVFAQSKWKILTVSTQISGLNFFHTVSWAWFKLHLRLKCLLDTRFTDRPFIKSFKTDKSTIFVDSKACIKLYIDQGHVLVLRNKHPSPAHSDYWNMTHTILCSQLLLISHLTHFLRDSPAALISNSNIFPQQWQVIPFLPPGPFQYNPLMHLKKSIFHILSRILNLQPEPY